MMSGIKSPMHVIVDIFSPSTGLSSSAGYHCNLSLQRTTDAANRIRKQGQISQDKSGFLLGKFFLANAMLSNVISWRKSDFFQLAVTLPTSCFRCCLRGQGR